MIIYNVIFRNINILFFIITHTTIISLYKNVMSFYYYNNRNNVKNKNIFLLTSSALFDIVSFKITTNKISIRLLVRKKVYHLIIFSIIILKSQNLRFLCYIFHLIDLTIENQLQTFYKPFSCTNTRTIEISGNFKNL